MFRSRPLRATSVLCAALLALGPASFAQEPIDAEALKYLREHGLSAEKSQVMETLSWLTDVHGPRLTASPNLERACAWTVEQLKRWGLADARIETWGPFGRGWRLDGYSMRVTGENPWVVHAIPKAWTHSTAGKQKGEVLYLAKMTPEQLQALEGKLGDKIVMLDEPRPANEIFEPRSKRWTPEELLEQVNGRVRVPEDAVRPSRDVQRTFGRGNELMRLLSKERPLAILDRGFKGDYGTIFVQGANALADADAPRDQRPRAYDQGATVLPQFTLAVEHYNRLARLAEKGQKIEIEFEIEATWFDHDGMVPNVLASLPGADPEIGSEMVMIGAHIDSWHSATGTTDNGCGSAVMLEAMRLLAAMCQERGVRPRRTIGIGLWSGEEQGLLGSRAFVEKHVATRGRRGEEGNVEPVRHPLHAKLSAYYNLDNGTGRIRGIYLQQNEACGPIFRDWLRAFGDPEALTVTINNTGGTDHQSFDAVGIPGFQFVQDTVSYSPQTHHSNMDLWDHALADDLRQAATMIAHLAWHTAQRDGLLPRKPERASGAEAERGGRGADGPRRR
jgi:carboxypeptidase Q